MVEIPLDRFPRTDVIPSQSPKYWAKEKDRYLRQILISDIEKETERSLVVYFSQLDQEINCTDPDDLSEIIQGLDSKSADILIQTPGGQVDATEKIIAVLRHSLDDYRVIVPSWAKSAGTVIALSSSEIIFGVNSELGPIDPQWSIGGNQIPCELIANDTDIAKHVRDYADLAAKRMNQMAKDILARNMMKDKEPACVEDVIKKISSTNGYMSHGAVIDYHEAIELGLSATFLPSDNSLWQKIWLLYCLYDYDTKAKNLAKVFEGRRFSISRPKVTC